MMRLAWIGLFLAVVSQGCWIKWEIPPTPEQVAHAAKVREDASKPVTCQRGDECEIKWARALAWIHEHSYWKLDTATDSIVTTAGPFSTEHTAYSVLKVPLGNGVYRLDFQAKCGVRDALYPKNDICEPKLLEAVASFVNYVNQ